MSHCWSRSPTIVASAAVAVAAVVPSSLSLMVMTTAPYKLYGVFLQPTRRWRGLCSFNKSSWSRCCSSPVSESLVVESCEEAAVTGVHVEERRKLEDLLSSRKWFLSEPSTKVTRILVSRLAENRSGKEIRPGEYLGNLSNLRFDLLDVPLGSSSGRNFFEDNLHVEEPQGSSGSGPGPNASFYVIRDELLHPLVGGNKLRKLDALLPQLVEEYLATDVVTCGGCQSAHTAALACACAEKGVRSHLLLRGEKPSIPTGYNLLSSMYGHTTYYVPRSEYADRTAMLTKYALKVAGRSGTVAWLDNHHHEEDPHRYRHRDGDGAAAALASQGSEPEKRVVVVKEGAGDAVAILGLIRLVHYMSQPSVFGGSGDDVCIQIVVDSGTGTTAVGLALGVSLLKLPWRVVGIMLAGTVEEYEAQTRRLLTAFCKQYQFAEDELLLELPLTWEERWRPRKFGKILPGEVRSCQAVAQQTGILLDPIYTLAGWETATRLSVGAMGIESHDHRSSKVVMLHTGGTLGLFGLAQRYPTQF